MNEENIVEKTLELFIAKMLSKMAGRLSGKQVKSAHMCVVNKVCKGKTGWDLLECIVDNMDRMYTLIREKGYEEAMKEMTCKELIPK